MSDVQRNDMKTNSAASAAARHSQHTTPATLSMKTQQVCNVKNRLVNPSPVPQDGTKQQGQWPLTLMHYYIDTWLYFMLYYCWISCKPQHSMCEMSIHYTEANENCRKDMGFSIMYAGTSRGPRGTLYVCIAVCKRKIYKVSDFLEMKLVSISSFCVFWINLQL